MGRGEVQQQSAPKVLIPAPSKLPCHRLLEGRMTTQHVVASTAAAQSPPQALAMIALWSSGMATLGFFRTTGRAQRSPSWSDLR